MPPIDSLVLPVTKETLAVTAVFDLLSRQTRVTSAASGNVRPGDDAAEAFVVGVVVTPDDVPADHAGLLLVAGVVSVIQREVPQGGELGPYPV